MSLPEEIIIQIVHEVNSDKKWFLERSTISRAFAKACQQWLYKKVAITSFNGQRRCQRLYHLLQESPHIARYIQEFSLQAGLHKNRNGSTSIWLFDEPLVPSLLMDCLPALQSINLTCSAGRALDWTEMPVRLQNSLQKIFALPSMKKVSLSNTRLPTDILKHTMGLAHLSVRRSAFTLPVPTLEPESDTPDPSSPIEKPRLRSLEMTSKTDTAFVNNLTTVVDLSGLRELVLFDTDQTTILAVSEIMQISTQTLERFKWDVPETFQMMLPSNDPSDNEHHCPLFISPALRHLEVGVHDWPHSEELWNPVAWAVRALRDFSERTDEASRLETLTIWILTTPYLRFGPEVVTEKWWGELDRTLTTKSVFPYLSRVKVTTIDGSLQGNLRSLWCGDLREQMPRLSKGRKLIVM